MLSVLRSTDHDLICDFLTNPVIFSNISNDACPDASDYNLHGFLENPNNIALLIYAGEVLVGVNICKQLSPICYDIHTNILPEHRKESALTANKKCIAWMFCFTPCQRLVTGVPDDHTNVINFLKRLGCQFSFYREGVDHYQGKSRGYSYFNLDLTRWIVVDNVYKPIAESIYSQVEEHEGKKNLTPSGDPIRMSLLGYTFLTANCGQRKKAQAIYNEWAKWLGLDMISIDVDPHSELGNPLTRIQFSNLTLSFDQHFKLSFLHRIF